MFMMGLLNEGMAQMEQQTADAYLKAVQHLVRFDAALQAMLLVGAAGRSLHTAEC